jgi:hypothetical protein
MPRAAGFIIHGNEIALIKRRREGRLYYVFPGGQVEEKESPEQAVVRNEEELNEGGCGPLMQSVTGENAILFPDACHRRKTARRPRMGLYPPERGSYHPVWMPMANLLKENVVPREVAQIVSSSSRQGWPRDVITLQEEDRT